MGNKDELENLVYWRNMKSKAMTTMLHTAVKVIEQQEDSVEKVDYNDYVLVNSAMHLIINHTEFLEHQHFPDREEESPADKPIFNFFKKKNEGDNNG